MIRVNLEDLQEGMVVAEPILDFSGKVLLAAKAQLTRKHIEILKTWDVSFVRIREQEDTDEKLEQDLALDKEKELRENEQPVQEQKTEQIVPESKQTAVVADLGINQENIQTILTGQTSYETTEQAIPDQPAREITSLVKPDSLKSYQDYLDMVTRLVEKNFKVKDVALKDVSEISQKITDYVTNTPGVIGYVLQDKSPNSNALARHLLGTSIVAGKIAMLMDLFGKDLNHIIMGSLLHDIGKIHIPVEIANRVRSLSEEEEETYQSHVVVGLGMLKEKNWLPKEVLLLIAQHHERIDGKGFPMGFKGKRIHPYAKIVAIADYFDSVMHRGNANLLKVSNDLLMQGNRFDLSICESFRTYLHNFVLTNKVRLEDGRLAEIVYMHQAFSEPVVRTSEGQFIDLNKSQKSKIREFMM